MAIRRVGSKARGTGAVLSLALCFAAAAAAAAESEEAPPAPAPADPRAGVFSDELPYASRFALVGGHRMHYIDEGEGDTFLFLHGNPTSIYLWRNVMRYVAPVGRIVAVDNVGFGRSDQPEGLEYTFQMHYAQLEGFIEALGLDDVVLVVHDWGSVLGLNYARLHSDRVKGVVFMEAIVPPAFPMESVEAMGPAAELFRQFRSPEAGKRLLIEENVFVEQLLLGAPVTRELSAAEKEAYRAPFTDPAKRFPIYMWPNELPIGGEPARNVAVVVAVGEWLASSETPKLVQYASPGVLVPPSAADWMVDHYRNLEAQFVGYGAHYIQEDNPEAIGRGIVDWHRRTFPRK